MVIYHPYNIGRLLKSAIYAEFKSETSDRFSAEVGPTADLLLSDVGGKNKINP